MSTTTTIVIAMGYPQPKEIQQQTWSQTQSISSAVILCLTFVYVMAVFHKMFDKGLRHQGWLPEAIYH